MERFVLKGKAAEVFRLIALMAKGEEAEHKKGRSEPKRRSHTRFSPRFSSN